MTGAEYIVDFIIQKGVTNAFGIPGGVILDFLYAMDRRKEEISAHLSYHEQAAAFAACGYAQATNSLGVAYATRGPGITNMITAIADAYCDSIPVLFLTAHGAQHSNLEMRVEADQEVDFTPMLSGITKYAARVDRAEELYPMLENAYCQATTGRLGPVVLDVSAQVLSASTAAGIECPVPAAPTSHSAIAAAQAIATALEHANRPVILIGDGVHQSHTAAQVRTLAERAHVPVLSSRFSQDVMADSPLYFGYIGSHATRYANFILSKADLIVALGNRLSFPVDSPSYRPLLESAKIIRIDIDKAEFLRDIPNSRNFAVSLVDLFPQLHRQDLAYCDAQAWVGVCAVLKDALWEQDTQSPIRAIAQLLKQVEKNALLVSDVGNHEMWLSRAYAYARASQKVLHSKSFGALGCAVAKSIGAHYATKMPVVCFTGDQGFQMNLQELQFVAQHRLPITIILLNNHSSGMIRSREAQRYRSQFLHTTLDSGYGMPDFATIAKAYGLDYLYLTEETVQNKAIVLNEWKKPYFVELFINEAIDIAPYLPRGNPVQELTPALPESIYYQLDSL